MSAGNFPACLAFTLLEEGGFVNNPRDPGGATNHGITLATLRHFTHQPSLGVADLKGISSGLVSQIYQESYWKPVRGDELPAGADLMVFDMGVNAGPRRSIELLQQALGVDEDGIIGLHTLAAVSLLSFSELFYAQRTYYRHLRGYAEFGRGWLARCQRRYQAAVTMATS